MGKIVIPTNAAMYLISLDARDAGINALVYGEGAERVWEYADRIEREFEHLDPELPDPPAIQSILDIGCGLAGLTARIAKNQKSQSVTLIDGEQTKNAQKGFKENMSAWADVMHGVDVVKANCGAAVYTSIGTVRQYDLVLSSRSWGLHYPLSVYMQPVVETTSKGSIVVVDVRNEHFKNAVKTFEDNGFDFDVTVDDFRKSKRLKFVRN